MSLMEGRGGVPHVWRETIPAAGRMHQFPFTIKWLTIHVDGDPVRIFFSEEDFLAGVNYIQALDFAGPVEAVRIWLLSTVPAGSPIELVAYQRRG